MGRRNRKRLTRLAREFAVHRDEASSIFPRVQVVTWRPTWEASEIHDATSTGRREFGFWDPSVWQIGLAPDLEDEDLSRIRGILRHEFGHSIDDLYANSTLEQTLGALPNFPEARADAIAVRLWGTPYGYDQDAVQSTAHSAPRPTHLPL